MKMLNGNISCTLLDEVTERVGNILVPTKDKSYKTLKVSTSNEELVPEGSTIYVPVNSGHTVEIGGESYVIVNIREIILILD